MNAMALDTPHLREAGLRDRIVSHLRVSPDRETKTLLKEILVHLDKPYDLAWMQDEFRLSPAEFRVLTLLARGQSPTGIAELTGNATSTVRRQIHDVYKKARVSNMAELTALLLAKARNP